MSVHPRTGTRSNRASAAAGPPQGLPEWLEAFVRVFENGTPEEQIRAGYALAAQARAGRLVTQLPVMAALAGLTGPLGRLAESPEAHLAHARIAMEAGLHDDARSEIRTATRLVAELGANGASLRGEAGRHRAALVNREAVRLYSSLGDSGAVERQWMVYRYWKATDAHRRGGLAVHRQDPADGAGELSTRRLPAIGVKGARPQMPAELTEGRNVSLDTVPPNMERRFSPLAGILELLHVTGNFARLLRQGPLWKRWDAEVAQHVRSRTYYEVPPRPDEVSAAIRRLGELMKSPDPRVRAEAERFASEIDLELALECAVAFWSR